MHKPLWVVVAALTLSACGMAERDDEGPQSRDYLTFTDAAFEHYCIETFDTNHDGRLSRYEAEGVRSIVCPNLEIESLDNIDAFIRLETLDCSGNRIERLSLDECRWLRTIDCSNNHLNELSLKGLRTLSTLRCNQNRLSVLDLDDTASLTMLNAEGNALRTLDLTPCSSSLRALTRQNPTLEVIYYRAGQQVDFESPTTIEER